MNYNEFTLPTKITKKSDEIPNQNENNVENRYSTIESVIDDCLLQICSYLEFLDIVNLSATCTRLQNFATDNVFRTKAKKITIEKYCYLNTVQLTVPWFNGFTSIISVESLETILRCIGKCVEDLTISGYHFISRDKRTRPNFLGHLEYFESLTALRLKNINCNPEETHTLHARIERLPNLTEFKIEQCDGIIRYWPSTSKHISKVEKLSLYVMDKFNIKFFQQFNRLTSLTIEIKKYSLGLNGLVLVFEQNGNCLEHLKIFDNDSIDYEVITKLINEKLPHLKRLEFEGTISDKSMVLVEMPLLKYLGMATSGKNLDDIMQKLSKRGIIEELSIIAGDYVGDSNTTPLVFNKLQKLKVHLFHNSCNLLKTLTTAHMPEIHFFEQVDHHTDQSQDLLKFVESKKTLKSLSLSGYDVRFTTFLRQLIEILQKSMPKRSILNVTLDTFQRLTQTDVELINENRHLIECKYREQLISN